MQDHHTHDAFTSLYPDVDPGTPIPVSSGERISTGVAAATLAYGAAGMDIVVTIAGLALVIISLAVPAASVKRRIRREARTRFPREPWAESALLNNVNTNLFVPVFWAFIAASSLGIGYFLPADLLTRGGINWGAVAAAVIAFITTWFMPGLSPVWLGRKKPDPDRAPHHQSPAPRDSTGAPHTTGDTSVLDLSGTPVNPIRP
ncbi:hemin receptor [Corynebacterium pacaense]|uniref:hemin receptor n=1 Tax=Corynebacterium pacaense TaxID=1816684 RepID=UPI001FEB1EE5|nr:hemin receptor [Corynebacterium pacaense]